jgi:hypothetical protein
VFAWVYAQQNAQNGISSIAATYGGTAMTLLSSVKLGNTNYGTLALFRLANVAGGAQTVSATATAPSGGISNLIGNSESILNVGTVGTITTNFGLAASVSVAATGVAQGVVINAFVAASTTGTVTLSSYNGTQRYMTAATDSPLVMGDTSTIGSFSFTASISGSFNWCGIAAVLTP